MGAELKPEWEVFCQSYVIDWNGTKAYQKAYPDSSYNAARSSSSELLTNPNIKAYIKELQEGIRDRLQLDADYVVNKLIEWIELDVTETINLSINEIKELPSELRKCITKFKRSTSSDSEGRETETIEIGFISKEKALEMLSKHIGFYGKDNEQLKPETTNIINLGDGSKPKSVEPHEDD